MGGRRAAAPLQAEAALALPRLRLLARRSPAGGIKVRAPLRAAAAAGPRLVLLPRAEGGTWAQALRARQAGRLVGTASVPAPGARPLAAAAAPASPACCRSGSGSLCNREEALSTRQQSRTCAAALAQIRAS